jgi:hypothetical protein
MDASLRNKILSQLKLENDKNIYRERLENIHGLMDRSARDAGREPEAVKLICVSKNQDQSKIIPVIESGECIFGENKVQEAQKKWPALREKYKIQLHLIGPLQTNKAEDAVELFDVIETLDRPKLAHSIAKAMDKIGKRPKLFIEVNVGEEPQKSGILPGDLDLFIKQCRTDYGLEIEGLMCIPPQGRQAAPYFGFLAQMAQRNGLTNLSMGMSADFDIAIQMGATYIRIGTALFGQR